MYLGLRKAWVWKSKLQESSLIVQLKNEYLLDHPQSMNIKQKISISFHRYYIMLASDWWLVAVTVSVKSQFLAEIFGNFTKMTVSTPGVDPAFG